MHGKILRYSNSTGTGVVTNYSKKMFELKKENWHDSRFMPEAGMYVEFRCDANSYSIQDCRASAWQNFSPNGAVRELDFWKTDTDEELINIETDTKNKIALKVFKETDYITINNIQVMTPLSDCIDLYFQKKYQFIEILSGDLGIKDPILNYKFIKRFLNKALDFLIFTDRTIALDDFNAELNELKHLEHTLDMFYKNTNLNFAKLYEECYLDWQYNYRAAQKAILEHREKILKIDNKIKNYANDTRLLRKRAELYPKEKKAIDEKLEKIKASIKLEEDEKVIVIKLKDKLIGLCDRFYKDNFDKFVEIFKNKYTHTINLNLKALNNICTKLDDKIWQVGMRSPAIKSSFYKHGVNDPFCSMAFMGQYINTLDVNNVSNIQRPLFEYYNDYREKYTKYFLILSENKALQLQLKTQTMTLNKNYSVLIAKKEIEFLTFLNKMKFDVCYIDAEIEGDAEQIIEDYKKNNATSSTKFQIIKKSK